MTILRLKNSTNIYRIDAKKLEGERGYLALEDLRIKSKFSRSNISISEVGRSGERKNPRGRRKKKKKARAGRLGTGLKHHLGAIDLGAVLGVNNHGAKLGANNHGAKLGAKLSAKIYGAKVPAKSPSRLRRAQDLNASNDGAEKCKLGASNDGAEIRVQILKSYKYIYEFFLKG